MLFSKRLTNITGMLTILALIYVLAGLPLIHPFLHHHCRKHYCLSHNHKQGFSNDKQPLKEFQGHSNCPICSFLQRFHINFSVASPVHDYGQCLSKVNLPLDTFLIKRFEHTDLFPRPPPGSIAYPIFHRHFAQLVCLLPLSFKMAHLSPLVNGPDGSTCSAPKKSPS